MAGRCVDASPVLLPSTSSGVADGSGARVPGTSGAGESAIVEDAVGSEVTDVTDPAFATLLGVGIPSRQHRMY